jgi:hypothetical protein
MTVASSDDDFHGGYPSQQVYLRLLALEVAVTDVWLTAR